MGVCSDCYFKCICHADFLFLDLAWVGAVESVAFGDVVYLPDRSPVVPGHFGGELGFDIAAVKLDGAAEEVFGAVWGFIAAFPVKMAADLLLMIVYV